jgi:hypothetical protein
VAFWKKGDDDSVPPPPAHHFNPMPASGRIAQSGGQDSAGKSSRGTDSEMQTKFNQLVDSAKRKESASTSDAKSEFTEPSEKTPIRSPYSFSPSKVAEKSASSGQSNAFDFGNTKPKTDLPDFDPAVAQAQSDFKAALGGSSQILKESLAAKTRSTTDGAKTLANDFQLPSNFAATKTDAVQSMGNSTYTGASELEKFKSEFEMAQAQIGELKKQIAESKVATNPKPLQPVGQQFNPAPSQQFIQQTQPFERVAELNPSTVSNNAATNLINQGGFASAPLRPQSLATSQPSNFSPLQPNGNVLRDSSQFAPASNGTSDAAGSGGNEFQALARERGNTYPSTPHGNYSLLDTPNASPALPSGESDGGYQVQSASHVAEIDIPAAVLRGSGSYAPGSVNPLTPD